MAKKLPIAKIDNDCPSPVSYKQTKADMERDRRYKAEDALRTMQRANEIKRDKELMRDMKSVAREQMKALKKI